MKAKDNMIQFSEKPFILIDGTSYLYRAYYAFPPLLNSAKEPTGVMYGVVNMLRSLILQYQPTHGAVVFDAKGKSFRNELFECYKLNRPSMPPDLKLQIKPLHKMVKAMGLPIIMVSGVEADDVIGTLAREAEQVGHLVLISTGDKDMAQLVTPRVSLINTMTNTTLGPKEVIMKYGVPPHLIIDFLALMGDLSDNIPGIPGVGKKTSQALIQGIGGLDKLYAHPDKISELKLRGAKTLSEKLKKNKEVAYLSYQLATIKTNVPLEVSCEQLTVQRPETDELFRLFEEYEFKRWANDVKAGKWMQINGGKSKKIFIINNNKNKKEISNVCLSNSYVTLLEEEQFCVWVEQLKKAPVFAFDIKTDILDSISGNMVGLSFAIEPGKVAYVPVAHSNINKRKRIDNISCKRALELLKPILEDNHTIKISQNLKFNFSILRKYNIELRGTAFDTMLESYTLDSVAGRHDMDSLSARWLQHNPVTSKKNLSTNKTKDQLTFEQTEDEEEEVYMPDSADVVLKLHLKMWPQLQQHEGPMNIFKHIEMPLIPVLSKLERNGVKIDPAVLHQHSEEIALRLKELKKKAYDITGETFNLSSIKELKKILFEKQGISSLKKTPNGALSTSEEVLAGLAMHYPLPKIIIEYRSLLKLKSTYTDKLPLMLNLKTGRVHTSYHQAVTATGRLSSTDPNLQNIPVRNREGRRIRQAFIAPEDFLIVSADYSQMELRIMAHLSQDKNLLMAFHKGKDIHCVTASEVFGLAHEEVTPEFRRRAKAINFGLMYGMGAFGLSRQLNITRKESQEYMDLYFKRYPGIREYIERVRVQAKEKGYVETLEGRRLYLPDIKSSNSVRRASAERAAINAPMQGTAADIMKRAMIAVDRWLEKEKPRARMIMQVHDELVFEVHKDEVKTVSKIIHEIMGNIIILDIPLSVKVGSGENWDHAH